MERLYPVIIAGGSGTRFWPISRGDRPKQFQPIVSSRTMIEETLARAVGVAAPERTLVIASAEHTTAIEETCREVPAENLILEPFGRDTAPAVGLAARLLVERDREALMLVLPADHRVEPIERFRAAVETGAVRAAEHGELVTFGIAPDHPATGYGYLHRGAPLDPKSPLPTYEVAAFCEKPDLETAQRFVAGGEHRWNSGIFLWRADRILEEIGRHLPDLAAELDHLAATYQCCRAHHRGGTHVVG